MANPCLQPASSDFYGYPGPDFVQVKTELFRRNNCGSGTQGTYVPYSKTYTSNISQEHLDRLILTDTSAFNIAGQNNANANGTCVTTCVPVSATPTVNDIAGINASNTWFRFRTGLGAGSIMTPSGRNVLTGSSPGLRQVYDNTSSYSAWGLGYPYNNGSEFYRVRGNDTVILLDTRSSSVNACTNTVGMAIGLAKGHFNDSHVKFIRFATGVFYVIPYNSLMAGSTYNGYDIYFYSYSTGVSTLINYQNRPVDAEYRPLSCTLVTNGSSVWLMLAFYRSGSDGRRCRIGVFRVDNVGIGLPSSLVTLQGYTYSNQWFKAGVGIRTTSRIFFTYYEAGGWKVYNLVGSGSATTQGMTAMDNCITDPTNTNHAYIGGAGPNGVPHLYRYEGSSNSWVRVNP